MNARSDSDVPYNGDALIGVSVAIAVVQIVVVIARFYTRRRLQQLAFALDDYLILLALVLACLTDYSCFVLTLFADRQFRPVGFVHYL